MNGRNAPLSPVSVGGNEWSGFSPPMDKDAASPFPNNRGQLASPPNSGGSVASMNGGYPPGPRSAGGPSPPPSVGRSSAGTNAYARSESGRSLREDGGEMILGEHYVVLKRFLTATSQNGQPTPSPNKARDKLQRLTPVQFLELSTDVYDELNRRSPAYGPDPPPKFLLPRDDFHPKRNQARQKLSSLPPPRFRDLATDVFCEVERRFPRFVAGDIPRMTSPASMRIPSRAQTPVSAMNGMNGFGPRSMSRGRRPSQASSVRSAGIADAYGVPPSPGLPPPGAYDRPMAKQSQSNTIVPTKSTMVEEDDDSPGSPESDTPRDAFGISNNGPSTSQADQKRIDEYEARIRELESKVEALEDDVKSRDSELDSLREGERSRSTAANVDKKEWDDARQDMENQLFEARNANDALQDELDRIKQERAGESDRALGNADSELQRENDSLRRSLKEQEETTEQVRREAQEFLREMRAMTQQSSSTFEKQTEMQKTIESLEQEANNWKSRYARAKTQLRSMRATSMGLGVDQDAAKYVRERGFTQESGLVKDFHVTKFQMSVDELLKRARVDEPEKVMEPMKAVVVSVRRITKDVDEAGPASDDVQRSKLKGRVSSTANNLITAAKNFASSAGISPVSLLDAAASHLVAAIVELLRTVKIRPTPAGELEDEYDDDDGTATPMTTSIGYFSPGSTNQTPATTMSPQEPLPPPPPFTGLGGRRGSADSSAYSPINSPRESVERSANPPRSNGLGLGNGYGFSNGNSNGGYANKNLPPAPGGYGSNGYGLPPPRDSRNEELKAYIEDQTAFLINEIQGLVAAIRADRPIAELRDLIDQIDAVVGKIVGETERNGDGMQLLGRLQACRERLLEAGEGGQALANQGKGPPSREWRMWAQTLLPIAFELARESKELVSEVDQMIISNGSNDYS